MADIKQIDNGARIEQNWVEQNGAKILEGEIK